MSANIPAVRGPAKAISNVIGGGGKLAAAKYDQPIMNPVNDVRKVVKEDEKK